MHFVIIEMLGALWLSQAYVEDVQSQMVNQEVRYGSGSTFHGLGVSFADFDNDGWDDITIQEFEPMNLTSKIEAVGLSHKATIEINKGTPPFVLRINNEVKGTYDSNRFTIPLTNGDFLTRTSGLACEGQFMETIAISDNLIVYPNPTSSVLNIPASTETSIMEVYNAVGQLVQTFKGKEPLSLSTLSKGVYFMVIKDGIVSKPFKIIITD